LTTKTIGNRLPIPHRTRTPAIAPTYVFHDGARAPVSEGWLFYGTYLVVAAEGAPAEQLN